MQQSIVIYGTVNKKTIEIFATYVGTRNCFLIVLIYHLFTTKLHISHDT